MVVRGASLVININKTVVIKVVSLLVLLPRKGTVNARYARMTSHAASHTSTLSCFVSQQTFLSYVTLTSCTWDMANLLPRAL